ncbi:DUF4865 family protein [Aeromonas veronii]|uniref:DUF4865 family protein n=1 Tax=Aeromonas veronii TaxID=654 RepID=UPI001932E917|nr:DUF4865 family protein [Aeromonas veronii]MBM0418583.1 DUF4865 family protein [Aeromonas veronii]MBW3790570.1 DUF4865 family protein [Aeromonas veronii]
MIAMHYRFTLPANYDMALIEERIALNGAKLDGFPGLIFKAYLYSRKDNDESHKRENRYAPFYVWETLEAMHSFLNSDGFSALINHFGRPHIETWYVVSSPSLAAVHDATIAVLQRKNMTAPCKPADITTPQTLCGWDVSRWKWLDIDFLQSPPSTLTTESDVYQIGYVARGKILSTNK